MTSTALPRLAIAAGRGGRAAACLAPLVPGAPTVARVDLGRVAEPDEGPLPTAEVDGAVCAAAVGAAVDAGLPVVLVVHAWGADPDGSVFGLDAWGRAAKALVDASGVVPIVAVVDGPCLGGAALVVGLADLLVLTDRARLHVSTPAGIERHTGVVVDDADIGSAALHRSRSGVAHHHSPTLDDAARVVRRPAGAAARAPRGPPAPWRHPRPSRASHPIGRGRGPRRRAPRLRRAHRARRRRRRRRPARAARPVRAGDRRGVRPHRRAQRRPGRQPAVARSPARSTSSRPRRRRASSGSATRATCRW